MSTAAQRTAAWQLNTWRKQEKLMRHGAGASARGFALVGAPKKALDPDQKESHTLPMTNSYRIIGQLVEAEFGVQLDGYEPGFDDAPALDILRENLTGRRLRKPTDRDAARCLCWWLIDMANHWDSPQKK